jgi:NAD(P)-dependent dehydrogenase (short-subunit alcohol dehydrogenase family)
MKHLIIGGNSGIGQAVVQLLGPSDCLIFSRSGGEGTAQHQTINVLTDDLPDLPDLQSIVYCPGTIQLKPFHRFTESDFLNDLQTNVIGAIRVLQFYHKTLKANNGNVVLFSTIAIAQGMSFHSSIAVSKGAVEGLMKSLAAEWAPNVRVNCVAPSLTNTPLAQDLLNTDQKREGAINRHPLKKIGEPLDIAQGVKFLIENQWITGQIIHIDGGLSSLKIL